MPERLSEKARAVALDTIPHWRFLPDRDAIARDFKFKDFIEAFGFMARVALLAQAADHHPDWSNSYNKVSIMLSTHASGGVTENDIALARAIDGIVKA